jgi:hypothetical protein
MHDLVLRFVMRGFLFSLCVEGAVSRIHSCILIPNSTEAFISSSVLSILLFRRRYLSFFLDSTGALVCLIPSFSIPSFLWRKEYLEGLVLGRVE